MSEQDALYSLIESGELLAVNGLEDTENGESSEGTNTVHVCQHCNKVFLKNSNYQTHLRTHTGEKPFVCCICMKQFARADYLKAHLVSHTGARPYTCGICDKTFTHVSSLNTHIRIHTGDRPYVCHICPRSFTKSSDLQRHLDIHREKLYTCFMCDKRFARVITLKKHLERCSSCFEDLSSPNSSILKYRGGSYQANDRKMKRRKIKMEEFDAMSSDEESVNKKIDETIKIGDHSEKEEPSVENNDLFIISPGNSLIQNSFDPTKTTFLIIPSQQNSFLLNSDLFKSNNITLPLQTLTLDLSTSNML